MIRIGAPLPDAAVLIGVVYVAQLVVDGDGFDLVGA